jgi:UDP-3-O-acyl-N-acetylglucosamine deacetylase
MSTIKKPVVRRKKSVNLTISADARRFGEELAAARGIKFTQLVEMLLRTELRAAGKLPPESGK